MDNLSIEVDDAEVVTAMDLAAEVVWRRLKAVNKITADRIANEARGRVRRRTGQTREAILVEETAKGDGYIVFIGRDRQHIARFLEFGTKFMSPKPFLYVSARIEEGAHQRRVLEALDDAIEELGLGDHMSQAVA